MGGGGFAICSVVSSCEPRDAWLAGIGRAISEPPSNANAISNGRLTRTDYTADMTENRTPSPDDSTAKDDEITERLNALFSELDQEYDEFLAEAGRRMFLRLEREEREDSCPPGAAGLESDPV